LSPFTTNQFLLNRFEMYLSQVEQAMSCINLPKGPVTLYEPCRYVLENGGKRIRPVLTLIASGLCGGDPEEALPAALSIELIHNFTLVHDDIMDEAISRRGRDTVHVKWDRSTAILVGDMLYAEAFQQLFQYASHPADRFLPMNQILLRSVRTVCEGQALDMELEQAVEQVHVSEYMNMIEGKTSALISGALMMGGVVAGVSGRELEWLDALGRTLGVAFQIQDDLMDAVADPDKFGKTLGGDIREGKKTFLLLTALESGNEVEIQELTRLMSRSNRSDAEVDRVIGLFGKTGSIRRAEERIEREYGAAIELVNRFDDSIYKEDLISLVHFLIDREY